jgi:hypothetical protein
LFSVLSIEPEDHLSFPFSRERTWACWARGHRWHEGKALAMIAIAEKKTKAVLWNSAPKSTAHTSTAAASFSMATLRHLLPFSDFFLKIVLDV